MDCRLYLTVYILIYLCLGTQSKVAYNKGSEIVHKTLVANDLPKDEKKPNKTSIDSEDVVPTPPTKKVESATYPFIVSIQRNANGEHLCGGTILSKQFVLTAAHCTLKPRQLFPKDISVVGGSTKLFDKKAKRFRVKAMKKHPQFIPLKGNDILLLQVEPEIPIDNIRYGTIDFRNKTRENGGLHSFLLGWGRTKVNKPKDLEVIPVRTMEDNVCRLDYRFKFLTISEICAMNSKGPRGPCDGDSGGPLVDESQQLLLGLLSYGRTPCQIGQPYAYTRISVYVNWIEQEMANMLRMNAKSLNIVKLKKN